MVETIIAAALKGQIDFAIITATEETQRAVLQRFRAEKFIQGKRQYSLAVVPRDGAPSYNVALITLPDIGSQVALQLTRDLIDDLDPTWIVSVGVGKALPNHKFSLGDVIVGNRIASFALETRKQQGRSDFDLRSKEMAREITNFQGTLVGKESQFADWDQGILPREIALKDFDPADFYGDKEWQNNVCSSLKEGLSRPRPRYQVGMIASSDNLVENQRLTSQLKSALRSVCLLETELAGICNAAENRPVLGICGIGGIIGLKTGFKWQEYAAQTAAALTYALISKTAPIEKTATNKSYLTVLPLHAPTTGQHQVIYAPAETLPFLS
jgi:nucleoside phosphorylase